MGACKSKIEGGGSGFVPGGKDGKTKIWLKGGKGQQWEGGVRVPGLVRWPGKIKGLQVLHNAVSTMDIMPTSIGIIDRFLYLIINIGKIIIERKTRFIE